MQKLVNHKGIMHCNKVYFDFVSQIIPVHSAEIVVWEYFFFTLKLIFLCLSMNHLFVISCFQTPNQKKIHFPIVIKVSIFGQVFLTLF